jgi:hypothetical protein
MAKIQADKIQVSICLTDIPKSSIYESKNGKKYLNLDIIAKKETDQYGKNLTVALSQTKEQREAKAETVWLGNGKTLNFDAQAAPAAAVPVQVVEQSEDLPF